jgi:tRNA/rRNA methyltransferase
MEIIFILVNPMVAENIGGAARAIKTMGFNRLRLVNPGIDHLDKKALLLAHGSRDILEGAGVFGTLDEALGDIDFSIATTAKRRSVRHDYFTASELGNIIKRKTNMVKKLALVFGREESGLSNPEIDRCDIASFIPLAMKYPSLNLSQAVMLYAYELSKGELFTKSRAAPSNNPASLKKAKKDIITVLEDLDLGEDKVVHNRLMEKIMVMPDDDLHLIHSFSKAYFKKHFS